MFIPPDGIPLPMVDITDGKLIKRVENQFESADPPKAGIEAAILEGSTRAVTFNTPFAIAPNVVVGLADAQFFISVCAAHNVSTTGFIISVNGANSVTRNIVWIATDAGDP